MEFICSCNYWCDGWSCLSPNAHTFQRWKLVLGRYFQPPGSCCRRASSIQVSNNVIIQLYCAKNDGGALRYEEEGTPGSWCTRHADAGWLTGWASKPRISVATIYVATITTLMQCVAPGDRREVVASTTREFQRCGVQSEVSSEVISFERVQITIVSHNWCQSLQWRREQLGDPCGKPPNDHARPVRGHNDRSLQYIGVINNK